MDEKDDSPAPQSLTCLGALQNICHFCRVLWTKTHLRYAEPSESVYTNMSFPNEWTSGKPQSLFFFSPRVTLGSSLCLFCDRLIDVCAVWNAGVFLSASDREGAFSGVARRRLNEAETVSGARAWGLCLRGEGQENFLPLAPSLWWEKVLRLAPRVFWGDIFLLPTVGHRAGPQGSPLQEAGVVGAFAPSPADAVSQLSLAIVLTAHLNGKLRKQPCLWPASPLAWPPQPEWQRQHMGESMRTPPMGRALGPGRWTAVQGAVSSQINITGATPCVLGLYCPILG